MPNPGQLIEEDRRFATGRGDELNQQQKDRSWNEQQRRRYYEQYGDEAYDPLIGGRGGYRDDEAAGIIDEQGLRSGVASPEDLESNFLTGEESNAMQGRPWDRAAYFDPNSMEARAVEAGGRQRAGVDDLTRGVYESITPDLGLSEGYAGEVNRNIGDTASRVRGAVDPGRLRADEGALDTIRMTPEERERMVVGAGITTGNAYRSALGSTDRAARASGVTDPAGMAAIRERYLRHAAGDSGDAMTKARIAADTAEAARAAQAEGIRMQGETAYSDRAVGSELDLGNRELGARERLEGTRLTSARDISNRRMDAGRIAGEARISTEGRIADQERQQRQYNAGLGTDIATGIERDTADRAGKVAVNRQAVNQGNQQTRFGQQYDVSGQLSSRRGRVADARLGEAAEGRGYLRSQAGAHTQAEQADYDRRLQTYGQQGQQQQNATGQAIQQDAKPKIWEKLLGAGLDAAATYASGGFNKAVPKPKG